MNSIKWGEFKLDNLFTKIDTTKLPYKVKELPTMPNAKFCLPALTAGIQNQGLNCYVPKNNATILNKVITISANGANTGATFFQSKDFTVLQDAYAIKWSKEQAQISDKQYLFMASIIGARIYGNYEWTNKAGWERIKSNTIYLPITSDNEIDFAFMESFIQELEAERIQELEAERIQELAAYLKASSLNNYELTREEEDALNMFDSINWQEYNIKSLFGHSTRGKRLKSADRIKGDLIFVTAGEVDNGISSHIGNEVKIFSANTTTIDMFGSAKYRNYSYGADDHIAVVHTENCSSNSAIFITASINKASHNGQFSYSQNFYAKDADALNIMLPVKDGNIDYSYMETLVKAIHKLVIKNVVKFTEQEVEAAKKVISSKT